MANPAVLQKKKGRYLWFAILGLGFQPDTAASSIVAKTNNLGPSMFDKPNKDAFYIVTHFLLKKLNPTRFNEAYRHCWPVLNHKADAEFRKVTCVWLREIMDETANAGPKVVASLFLSPGGPRFTNLMLHLANHVMLQEMKTFTTDGSWVPEAAAMPASSLDMAVKRLNLISTRFLKTAVEQDRFLQEYQRRAQVLVKSMRDIRADGAKYDDLLKCYSRQEHTSPAEKIKKVRSLWSTIDEILSSTKEEQHAVQSVIKGEADQYTLDGTDQVVKISKSLLERIQQLPHQLSSGNVYESGQLNLLCVLELTNHALQLLKEERSRVSHLPHLQLNPQHLQEKCQQMNRVLQDLHLTRQKISKEEIPEVKAAIRELEAEWDKKWMSTLKHTPLLSFLNEDPALGFLSPMAPLSFEPAAETSYKSSVFSQYPAKLLDEKLVASKAQEGVIMSSSVLRSACPATTERASPDANEASSRPNTSFDWLFDATSSPPLKTPSASVTKTGNATSKVTPLRTTAQIVDMECDNLADQFADAVTTNCPTQGRVKGLNLEDLLVTLHGDPFSTRKQLPRTPESLIMDVKSSWRKAIEEDEAEKILSARFNDSITGRLTPLSEQSVWPSPTGPGKCDATFQSVTHHSPPASQQGVLKSTLVSDTFNAEAIDSPSGTGSSAVQFSLDQETLPEMPSCDSLLSLDDEAVDMKSEEEDDLLIPSLKTELSQTLTTSHHRNRTQQACSEDSVIGNRKETSKCLLSPEVAGLSGDWLMDPVKPVEATDKVFSLDLDTLGTPSPQKKQEYCLPKLITFSPVDDMKY
ncbi:HAUS augmin-like complex subunit 6 isoform X2 [Sphaeramia orbicularis]|uniref:HAUS augmin-like complex subunit 6 N-terminal domain-containing protein n=1 Tax=Sphaeramia orbicularis TaxID=375764 RepID=A0A672ZNN9_9TELE|nr:HAUS augmin-like complex subunit 6 isoform X2 [Sphaeramia orbicularis]